MLAASLVPREGGDERCTARESVIESKKQFNYFKALGLIEMVDLAVQRDIKVAVKIESDDSVSKVAEISYGAGKARTPARALFLSARDPLSESRAIQLPEVRGINEIYRRISSAKVDEIDSDLDAQRDFQSRVLLAGSEAQLSDELLITTLSLEEQAQTRSGTHGGRRQANRLPGGLLVRNPSQQHCGPPRDSRMFGRGVSRLRQQFFHRLPSHRRVAVAG